MNGDACSSGRHGIGSRRHRSGSLRSGRRGNSSSHNSSGHGSGGGSARNGGFSALSSSWDDLPEMARNDTRNYAAAGSKNGKSGSMSSGRSPHHHARRASVSGGALRSDGERAKSDGASDEWPTTSSSSGKHGVKRAQSSSSLKIDAAHHSPKSAPATAAAAAHAGVAAASSGNSRELRRSSSGNGSNSRLAEQDPITQELFALMFRVRGGLSRHDFGLLHEGLFAKARCGTKRAVER